MSTQHGGTITLKPISEITEYIKNLIPANIPNTYALKPRLENVSSEENIRNGVIAFRDFLYLFCDRLITDGDVYAKPPKNPANMMDYPFLNDTANLLVEIGYYSKLSRINTMQCKELLTL